MWKIEIPPEYVNSLNWSYYHSSEWNIFFKEIQNSINDLQIHGFY